MEGSPGVVFVERAAALRSALDEWSILTCEGIRIEHQGRAYQVPGLASDSIATATESIPLPPTGRDAMVRLVVEAIDRLAPATNAITSASNPVLEFEHEVQRLLAQRRLRGQGAFELRIVDRSVAVSDSGSVVGQDRSRCLLTIFVDGPTGAALGKHSLAWHEPRAFPAPAAIEGAIDAASEDAARVAQAQPGRENPRASVVLGPRAAATLIHEVVGHRLEADNMATAVDPSPSAQGSRIGVEELNVFEDSAGGLGDWGWMAFDDEGVPTRRVRLVEKGIIAGCLRARDGVGEASGHAVRQSYRHAALPRFSRLVTAPGRATVDDLIQGAHSGAFIRQFSVGTFNSRTGLVSLRVQDASEIVKGKVGRPISGQLSPIAAVDLLSNVQALSSELSESVSLCTKKGQLAFTSEAAPHVLLTGIDLHWT